MQRIFDYQQTAEPVDRNAEGFCPAGRTPRDTFVLPAARKTIGQPLRHSHSMGATVRLKTCGFHSVTGDAEMETHPGVLTWPTGFADQRDRAVSEGIPRGDSGRDLLSRSLALRRWRERS